jgi:multicomponent K+:H+ antiporter subunit G
MSAIVEYLVCAMLLLGGGFALVGSWGMAKLGDFYMRLHGPTKASTLGVGGVLLAAMLWQLALGQPSLRELLITLFLFMTAPVSAHLMAKAALALDPDSRPADPK